MPDDADQLRFDLDAANARIAQMRQAIAEQDAADIAVKDAQRVLAQARRRAKEARWKVSVLMQSERTKAT